MNKKILVLIITLILSLNFSTTVNAVPKNKINANQTWIVDDEGDGDYKSIQEAINLANPGDTIEIYSGTYKENINLDKQLTIRGMSLELGTGQDTGNPVISAKKTGDIFLVLSDGCQIFDLNITKSIGNYNAGIHVEADNINISRNNMFDNFYGIIIKESKNCNISNNYISNNIFGTAIAYSKNNIIVNNSFYHCGLVIYGYLSQVLDNIVINNTVNGREIFVFKNLANTKISEPNAGQIMIFNCTNCIVENMSISNTTIGMMVEYSSNLIFRNNNFFNIHRGGISLYASNVELYDNSFKNCSFSIYLEDGCKNIDVHHNNFIKIYQHDIPVFLYFRKRQTFVNVTNVFYDANFWDDWIGLKYPFMRFFPKMIPGYINKDHKNLFLPPIFLFDRNPATSVYQ